MRRFPILTRVWTSPNRVASAALYLNSSVVAPFLLSGYPMTLSVGLSLEGQLRCPVVDFVWLLSQSRVVSLDLACNGGMALPFGQMVDDSGDNISYSIIHRPVYKI